MRRYGPLLTTAVQVLDRVEQRARHRAGVSLRVVTLPSGEGVAAGGEGVPSGEGVANGDGAATVRGGKCGWRG